MNADQNIISYKMLSCCRGPARRPKSNIFCFFFSK